MNKLLPKIIGFVLNIVGFLHVKQASQWALDLFSKPLKGRFKTPHSTLEEALKIKLSYDGMDIQTYQWKGQNETVLLAHGWESNSGRWKNTIIRLQKLDYNIVALDAPAHGASGSAAFNAVLYSKFIEVVCEKFKPTALIGHSVGGMAISFFLKNSDYPLAKKLILLGAPAGFPGIFKNYTDLMGFNSRVQKGIEARIIEKFGFPSSHFNTAKFLRNTTCSGLIVHDKGDPIIPFSDALEIEASYENSTLISTSGLGHGLKSKKVVDAIVDFLKG